LLAAGFFVARGLSTGEKHETTIAVTPPGVETALGRNREYLDAGWLKKWERSNARFPQETTSENQSTLEGLIRNHPQFQV